MKTKSSPPTWPTKGIRAHEGADGIDDDRAVMSQDLVATGNPYLSLEGLEVVQVDVGQGEIFLAVNEILDLVDNGSISGQFGQRTGVEFARGPMIGQNQSPPGHDRRKRADQKSRRFRVGFEIPFASRLIGQAKAPPAADGRHFHP